ncbi:MAG TPA: hypothetical protein VF037_04510 [Gemmatimonadales bacterium]
MPGYTGRERRRDGREWNGPERRIAPSGASQLLEEGDLPSGPAGTWEDNVNEFTSDGGAGTNTPNEWTAARNRSTIGTPGADDRETREPDEADPETGGTGDEGGASTTGGGVFEGQGNEEDAPRYGDWTRHSTGATSGARGHEGIDFPDENTWGEEEAERERKE